MHKGEQPMSNDTSLFKLLGFHLEEVQLNRPGNEIPIEIKLKVDTIEFSSDEEIINLTLKICLKYHESSESYFLFRSVFKINKAEIGINEEEFNLNDLNENEESLVSSLMAFVFPYFRQNLSALTNDSAFIINLPIIDTRQLIAGIKLTYNEQDE